MRCLVFFTLVILANVNIIRSECIDQRFSLTILFKDTNQNNTWINKTNWLVNDDYCTWYGVECDEDNSVSIVNLNHNGLVGKLDDSIGCLKYLNLINLSNNNLNGVLPKTLMFLNDLDLIDIRNTSLTLPNTPNILSDYDNGGPIGNNFGMISKVKDNNGSVYNNDNDNNNNNNLNLPTFIKGNNNTLTYNNIIINYNINYNKNVNKI